MALCVVVGLCVSAKWDSRHNTNIWDIYRLNIYDLAPEKCSVYTLILGFNSVIFLFFMFGKYTKYIS